MRKIPSLNTLIKDREFTKKIYVYMSTKTGGDAYDSFEKNFTFTNLNPTIIKGYIRELTPETAFWKQYGLSESKMLEIFVESKYENYFRLCNKIVIDSDEYQVFKSGTGSNTSFTKRPFNILRVVLKKNA